MSPEEVRLRSMELAFRVITSGGPRSVSASELEGVASHVARWANQTPATGADLDAYAKSNPDELIGLRDSLRVRFNINASEASYVLARTVAAVLECRKAQASKTDASGAANG